LPPAASRAEKFLKNKSLPSSDRDAELVARCLHGEREAQFKLYECYKNWVFNVAFRMTNHQQEAEDITQQVFAQVFKKLSGFRSESAFSSWIYRIAVNICINHFHKLKKHKERISNELSSWENTDYLEKRREAKTFDLRPYLEKAIRSLPEGYRMVFILYDVEGYSHNEIGKMMNISEGTSKSQLHKARRDLKRLLEPLLELKSL